MLPKTEKLYSESEAEDSKFGRRRKETDEPTDKQADLEKVYLL